MIFTPEEKVALLTRLPPLELSYEPKLHKKVYSPIYYIIPKGPKALIWYTYWNDQHICVLINLNERGNYSDVQVFPSIFGDTLALGTIIYGTSFLHQQRRYFTCEKLYYYKGLSVIKKTYNERLNLLLDMFTTQVEQLAYTSTSLVVGMPLMTETYEEAVANMEALPYRTYGIGIPPPSMAKPMQIAKPMPMTKPIPMPTPMPTPMPMATNKVVFRVKADLIADNYHLFTVDDVFYDTAMIPTYKSSVMMNALFRNIKENANLDLLEESDEEDEFENTQIDKFVDLEKTYTMECVYSKRFKKWQPLKLISNPVKIITLKELQNFNISRK
jgi:hypothetical protein